ncbi:hypothetical protein [Bradyrhizobium japonicum]|uniref:hypothetical protein n=1 Tax=Bradyrhizobium japonicum TaxID=375 RepID=UPI0012BBBF2C|nr:hypothetical protein [Bradyrhizobium japonicum]MCP1747560.1 hypothetical protein [Bradyrhizobium japonicum]MCP1865164.1 hypothetical protein [Bradyrhizobium japonicum]MCP1896063.1 hypothetical protein [Bradyrhizobium japonicum]MCW2329449.1 hypothetical protein [Bradyrhizobium japonicum]WLB97057.1 hypothetical protein QIH92_47500 [Bradyrhizobium japonicum USDA 123]
MTKLSYHSVIVIAFNELEVALGGALMHLLKQDEDVGAAFVAHLGASQKIRLLQELDGKIDHEATRQEFRSKALTPAVQGLSLVMCDKCEFMRAQDGMNIGGLTVLFYSILESALPAATEPTGSPEAAVQQSSR